MMEKGDKVYVNWPTERGGPYKVASVNFDGSITIEVNGEYWWDIEEGKYEPAEPELEEGRLYYYWDADDNPRSRAEIGESIAFEWDNIEPVNRRWEELEDKETRHFSDIADCRNSPENIFKEAYKLITRNPTINH